MKILILFGHPAFQNSRVNRKLLEGIEKLSNVTFHDLYEAYPEMDIDIDHEQKLLKEHDCIIFHHPMYWYSTPAIFKEWQDLVLEHGWAYGKTGSELKGKYFFNVITSGSPKIAFEKEGFQGYTVLEFLAPIQRMAKLCKMTFLPPFVVHGTHNITDESLDMVRESYHKLLVDIVKEKIELSAMADRSYLNDQS